MVVGRKEQSEIQMQGSRGFDRQERWEIFSLSIESSRWSSRKCDWKMVMKDGKCDVYSSTAGVVMLH